MYENRIIETAAFFETFFTFIPTRQKKIARKAVPSHTLKLLCICFIKENTGKGVLFMEPYTFPLCSVTFNDKAEIPLEFEAALPEYLPGIGKIIRTDADVYALSSTLSDGHITVKGKTNTRLLYNDEKQGFLKCAVFPNEFEHTFDASKMPETVGTPVIEESGCILSAAAKPKNPRSVSITLGLALCVSVTDIGEISLLSPEEGETELRPCTALCTVHKKMQSEPEELKEDIVLDGGLAPIADIVDYTAAFSLDDIAPTDENIRYNGRVLFKCTYRAESAPDAQNAEYVYLTKELPFEGEIPSPDAHHGQTVIGKIRPEGMEAGSSFDAYGENRVIHVSLGYKVFADLFDQTEITYFDDGFSPAYECDFGKNTYSFDSSGQTVSEHGRLEQSLRADREGFTEITDAGIRLEPLTPELSDGKLTMTGRAFAWVLGANEKAETVGTSAVFNIHLPLESVRDMTPEKRYLLNTECKNCNAVLRDGEILLTADTETTGICLNREKITAIDRADIHYDEPKPLCKAEYIIYYPEKEENLWDIAKKYEIPQETLRRTNGFGGDSLPPNRKTVVIPCGDTPQTTD